MSTLTFEEICGLRMVKPHGYAGIGDPRPPRPEPEPDPDPVGTLVKAVGRKQARKLMAERLRKEATDLELMALGVSNAGDSEVYRKLAKERSDLAASL